MNIAITLTDKELHDLANQVQIANWKIELGQAQPSVLVSVGQWVLAAASSSKQATDLKGSEPAALEYAGMYFAMKAAAEHLEVQNALLMNAVQQMAHRGALMQSALIEAGLVSKIPPPVRLLDAEAPVRLEP